MRQNLLKKNLRLRKKNLMISRKPLRKVKRKPRPEDVVVVAAGADAGGEARKRKERKRRDSRSLLRTSPLPSNSSNLLPHSKNISREHFFKFLFAIVAF